MSGEQKTSTEADFQQSEIDSMLSGFASATSKQEPVGDAEEEPTEEETTGEQEIVEEEEAPETEVEPESEEEPVEEEAGEQQLDLEELVKWEQENQDAPDSSKNKDIEDLRGTIAQLQSQLASLQSQKGSFEQTATPVEIKPKDYMKDVDLDDLITNPEALNKLLNEVRSEAAELGFQRALQASPEKLRRMVNDEVQVTVLTSQLFSNKPEYIPIRDFVAQVAKDIEQKNPTWNAFQIFAAIPKEVDSRIASIDSKRKEKQGNGKAGKAKPTFAGQKGRRGKSEKEAVSEMQREIDNMIARAR